jgi:uncharacterized membrane protein
MSGMNRRSASAVAIVVLLLVAIARPLSAEINVLTHDATDIAPHRVTAALNLGVVAISLLVTWSDGLEP